MPEDRVPDTVRHKTENSQSAPFMTSRLIASEGSSVRSALFLALLAPLSAVATSIIQFKSARFEGGEASGTGHLTLTCAPPPTNRIVVLLKANSGSADVADLRDVNSLAVNLGNWQAGWPVDMLTGNSETGVGISIVSDGAPEPDESLHFTLTVLAGDAVVGTQSNAVFTIRNGHSSIGVENGGVKH